MSSLSEPSELLDRVLQLQRIAAAEAVPLTFHDALVQARLRATRDAELRELLAEFGAALVDSLVAGRQSEFLASLAGAIAAVPASASAVPASTTPAPAPTAYGATFEPLPSSPPTQTPVEECAAPTAEEPLLPPAPAAPLPQPVAVTPEVIRSLQRRLKQNGLQRDARMEEYERATGQQRKERLGRYVEALGPTPAGLLNAAALREELAKLERTIPGQPRHWAEVGKEANHALTSWAAARTRAAQDATRELKLTKEVDRMDRIFPRLSRHSNESQPGRVHGLARVHQPRGGGWLDDARAHEKQLRSLLSDEEGVAHNVPVAPMNHDDALRRLTDELRAGLDATGFNERVRALLAAGLAPTETRLVRLARPYLANLEGDDLAPLRRAIERDLEEEAVPEAEGDSSLPADWPWFAFTRDKRCALVGGEPRPERRERLQDAFGFASLDWLPNPTRGVRRVHALTQQMRAGSLDVVIVLRAFISHKVSDKLFAAESPDCRTILADNYGVTQVRLGFERFLAAVASEPEITSPAS